jgi:hypothetical protein
MIMSQYSKTEVFLMKQAILAGVVLVVAVVICVSSAFYSANLYNMNTACAEILNAQTTDIEKRSDGNGNLLVYDYDIFKDKRVATVTSVGRDGVLGTADDKSVSKTDYNKSYLGGKFVGERAKDLLDGVVEGAKAKSKFEE